MRGFAFVLAGKHSFFARDDRRIEVCGIQGKRIGRGDMKSNQTPKRRQRLRIPLRLQGNEDADLAEALGNRVMDILANEALTDIHGGGTPQCHIFAYRGDGIGDRIAEGAAAWIGRSFQGFDISRAGFDGEPRDVSC